MVPTMAFDHDLTSRFSQEEEYVAFCLITLADDIIKEVQSREDAARNNVSPQQTPVSSHKCGVCNKVFQSHQALGGHKTSHRKPHIASGNGEQTNASSSSATGRTHECCICHQSFPTGQALGGHKRLHYEGRIGKKTSSSSNSSVKSESESVSQSQCSGVGGLWFDLNMLPEIDQDEDKREEFEGDVVRKKPRLF